MPKRKRSVEEEVEQSFEKHTKDLFRALKAAKGFERQRLAKRTKDQKLGQETLRRLDHEVLVLKSLDLHQAAHAHLCSALLKVKAAAQSPHLPERLRKGVPKPDISDEERAALHNVTSALYKRNQVRAVMDKAIPDLCALLGVPAPGFGSGKKGAASKQAAAKEDAPAAKKDPSKQKEARSKRQKFEESESESSDPSPEQADDAAASGDDGSDSPADDELDEAAISRMEAMLGRSSSEDEDDGDEEELGGGVRLAAPKSRGRKLDDDDISLPGSDSVPEDEDGDELGSYGSASDSEDEAESDASADAAPPRHKKEKVAASPEPATKPTKDKKAAKAARPTNSTFLPSLMGGYVSGSESASDVDVAPPVHKNRRGQKARQAIWEKKYGEGAKHLTKPERKRDAGWDARRGAVDPDADGKPWKRGVRNPLQRGGAGRAGADEQPPADKPKKAEKKRDDDGALHPSWLAKKKAKQAQESAKFEGKKIVFD